MISEEKVIQQMQKRKARIIALCVFAVMSSLLLGFTVATLLKGVNVIRPVHPYTFDSMKVAEHLPELLAAYAELTMAVSKMYALSLLLSCVLGVSIGQLIMEIRGQTHARLIASMWSRLKQLEKGVHPESQGDGRPVP
jgi:hypothetical protein